MYPKTKKETYHRLVLVLWVGCFIDGNKPSHAFLDQKRIPKSLVVFVHNKNPIFEAVGGLHSRTLHCTVLTCIALHSFTLPIQPYIALH